ncbi:MAG: hypothetical protein J6X25_00200 [Bacteroidales bacterium]|nr:hypothetical protein [Bacteroidales bacterium]
MKKYFEYIAAGLLALTALSCEKAQDVVIDDNKDTIEDNYGVRMTVTARSQETLKSDIDLGLSAVVWDADDAIAIYDGTELREFTVVSRSANNTLATFAGSAAQVDTYYAISPYSATSLSGNEINVSIPSTQTVVGSHCVASDALLSTSTFASGSQLSFTNQFSLLKVTLQSSDVVSIQLKGNNGEGICGKRVFDTGSDTVTGTPNGKDIFLVYKETAGSVNSAFPAGDYFIALWPTTFSEGFKLVLTKSDGSKAAKSTSAPYTFVLNSGVNATTVDNITTWVPGTITTANQLKMWRRIAETYTEGETVRLGADIDLDGYNWIPAPNFKGIFDGQNHRIYNFSIGSDSDNCMGFIRVLGTPGGALAEFKNVVFEAGSIQLMNSACDSEAGPSDLKGWSYAGVIGYAKRLSKITNVVNYAPVSATSAVSTKHAIGGIVGGLDDQVTIENCVNHADITDLASCTTGEYSAIGGVVGVSEYSNNSIISCQNYGKVENQSVGTSCIAGILGHAPCKGLQMTECANHGFITNKASSVTGGTLNWDKAVSVAGVLGKFGQNNNANSYIDKCTNDGQICLGAAVEGDYRQAYGGIIGSISYKCQVRGCSNSGKIYDNATCGSNLAMGGILGSGSSSNLVITEAPDGIPCTNDGEIFHYKNHTSTTWFGGIAGIISTTATIEHSVNNGRLVSDPSGQGNANLYVGGICGASKGKIKNCINNGYVFTWAGKVTAYIGGICGGYESSYKPEQILDCTNNGWLGPYNTTGSSITGGIMSRFYPSETEVRRCTNTGLITSGNFYSDGTGNTPSPSVTSFQKKDYYMAGLFGRVEAPTYDVTDNVTDCIVACTIKNKTNADGCDDWTALIAGKTFSTGSTEYKLVFGTAGHPIMIVNTSSIEFADVSGSNETISTTAIANKWLMGSSSSLYSAANGSSDTDKVDFHYEIVTPTQAGIQ